MATEADFVTALLAELAKLKSLVNTKNHKAQASIGNISAMIVAETTRLGGAPPPPPPPPGPTGATGPVKPPPPPSGGGVPTVGINSALNGAKPFDSTSWWNRDVSKLPLFAGGAAIVTATGGDEVRLHPDFGTTYNGQPNGIPYNIVPANQKLIQFTPDLYASSANAGMYPIPANIAIENPAMNPGDDHHVIVAQLDAAGHLAKLFEMYQPTGSPPNYTGGFGCIFDMTKGDKQRPVGWTSADAAGLPLFPGLVKFDEVAAAVKSGGDCGHAFRFTIASGYSKWAMMGPATHVAGWNQGPMPFGAHLRLAASFVIPTSWPPEVQAIARTLKKYGMIQADNGGNYYLSGAPDPRWNDGNLVYLGEMFGAGVWEMIDNGPMIAGTP